MVKNNKNTAKQRRAEVNAKLERIRQAQQTQSTESATRDEKIIFVLPPAETEIEKKIEERLTAQSKDSAEVTAADNISDNLDGSGKDTADLIYGDSNQQNMSEIKKRRRSVRITVEELKSSVTVEEARFVEFHDANAHDPQFLVKLKAMPNTIPVPRHWWQKSLFLKDQIDRMETDAVMPAFLEKTGVAAMRPENAKVDPHALALPFVAGHPRLPLSAYGDVFYDGKDLRARFRRFRPGVLSERLRNALGMTLNAPPPWIYGMQKLGRLPPAYPQLIIPGLNAPIPAGAKWGKSKGSWGEPARDQDGNLIFPGVVDHTKSNLKTNEAEVTAALWGTEVVVCTRRATKSQVETAAPKPNPDQQIYEEKRAGPVVPEFIPQKENVGGSVRPGVVVSEIEMRRKQLGVDAVGISTTEQFIHADKFNAL